MKKAGGVKCQKLLGWMVLIYMVGVCTGLLIMLGTLAAYICTSCGVSPESTQTIEFRSLVSIPAGYLVLAPLSSLRDMSALSFAAALSLSALAYTAAVLLIEMP